MAKNKNDLLYLCRFLHENLDRKGKLVYGNRYMFRGFDPVRALEQAMYLVANGVHAVTWTYDNPFDRHIFIYILQKRKHR